MVEGKAARERTGHRVDGPSTRLVETGLKTPHRPAFCFRFLRDLF